MPDDPQPWLEFGRVLLRLGRAADADFAFDRYFALSPTGATLAEAAMLQQSGDIDGALALYRAILGREPDSVDALRLCGLALAQKGQLDEAETQLRRCLALAPDFVFAWNNLGSLLYERDRLDEAVDAFERAIALDVDDAQSHFNLGNTLAAADAHARAAECYGRALELQPGHAGALIGKGHVLKTIGKQHEAIEAYRACIVAKPDYGQVWWSLANLKTYRFTADEIARMERLLDDPKLFPDNRIATLFALGKASEDAGDFARAFAFYSDGNRAQRAHVAYDPVQTETLNDRIIDLFDEKFFAGRAGFGHDDPAPIFIVGLPRSGSTLIEQILASHSQVDGTSELSNLGQLALATGKYRSDGVSYPETLRDLEAADFAALGRAYIEQTRWQRGAAVYFTDKMPNNFPTIGFLKLILPNAKVIDARRHPMDSCMGSFKQLFAKGQTFTYDLFELAEYYLQYVRIMKHWDRVLPGTVLRVDYEAMLADQEGQTRRILTHCGLAWEDACLDFHRTERAVKTASSEQVRQPVYKTSLQSWWRFAPQLADLEQHLAPVLAELPDHVRAV
jgi:tetratricopeptide (TPR) repeat protein